MRIAGVFALSWLTGCSSSNDSVDARVETGAEGGTAGGAPENGGSSAVGGIAGTNGGSSGVDGVSGTEQMPKAGGSGMGASAGSGGALEAGSAGAAGSAGLAGDGAGGMAGAAGAGAGGDRQFSIRFDYRFDTVGFFDVLERRAVLEAAGAVWSRLLRDDFGTVPAGTSIRLRNPENRDEYVWAESIEEDIDDLLVFVGSSEAIPGLGRGGPSGTAETADPDLQTELSARRDGSDFEPWAGSISFNASSDFFFDPTPETADDIPFEQFDFMTNALHELGHVLGFNAGVDAFSALTDNQAFVGSNAQSTYGGPVPLTDELGHFPQGTLFEDMEPLMDAGQTNGIRTLPTALDLAVLRDIGYEVAP